MDYRPRRDGGYAATRRNAGQSVAAEPLAVLARDRGLTILEDACHALGSEQVVGEDEWRSVGACARSAMTAFSFHPVKTIAAGEGGAVTTNDPALAARLVRLRNHGLVREPVAFTEPGPAFAEDGGINPWYYELAEPGFNYRLTDLQSALALSQLGRLELFAARRRRLAELYDRLLEPLAPVVLPPGRVGWCRPVWHLYCARVDFARLGRERSWLMAELKRSGIGTQVHYIPLHCQPYYRRRYGELSLPGAEVHYARALSLPLFPAMDDQDVVRVVGALTAAVSDFRHK
ncbi:hypothetical protein WCLP8_2550002 [uncultured Gammaproteobacteria bacterium]